MYGKKRSSAGRVKTAGRVALRKDAEQEKGYRGPQKAQKGCLLRYLS